MIYLDNGATTRPFIFEAEKDVWLNSHSSYSNGDYLLWECRERIAKCINCEPNEIYFTSGGCEGNTWCINMLYEMLGREVLVSPNEHKSIMNNPRIEIGDGKRVSRKTYDYDSCMLVNNETGVMYDCDSIHKDMVQALGKVKINVRDNKCRMATFSGHKIHGDKGVGFVYISEKMSKYVKPLIYGGGQERGVRGGTVDVIIFIYFVYLYLIFIHLLCICTQTARFDIVFDVTFYRVFLYIIKYITLYIIVLISI